uniref:Uncharacterized protein n=1 Tax=Stegastes partitus TaxID=144197 RepID=A0A3B5BC55_9TELE
MYVSAVLQSALVDVFDGEFAPQHLDKHLPELPGGEVVEERIDNGAEVEEAVGHRVEGDVAPEVGSGPAGLGQGGHHQTPNLVGNPAHRQRSYDEAWGTVRNTKDEKKEGNTDRKTTKHMKAKEQVQGGG